MGMHGRMMMGSMGGDTHAYDHRIARRLLAYLRPHRRRVALTLILVALAMGAFNAGPLLLKIGIDCAVFCVNCCAWRCAVPKKRVFLGVFGDR